MPSASSLLLPLVLLGSAPAAPVADLDPCRTVEFWSEFPDPGAEPFTYWRNAWWSALLHPYHYMPDLVVAEGELQSFYFHGLYGRALPSHELFKEEVQLHLSDAVGDWRLAAVERSTRGGDAGFVLQRGDALELGTHHIKAWVPGDGSEANAFTWVWKPGMKAVVSDIDGTCTLDDLEQYLDLIFELGPIDYVPEEKPGAAEVLNHWSAKNVAVVYITARPAYLKEISIQWLREMGFPLGPIILYGASGGVLPPLSDAEKVAYKARRIDDLEERIGVRFLAAYGNSSSDRDAFCEALEIPPERFFMIDCVDCEPLPGCENTQLWGDWYRHLEDLENAGIPRVPQPCD